MAAERIVIVGAGPAGLATARAYREHGGVGEVTLLGDEQLLPYRRPPLTKQFLRGELDARELPIERREWFEANRVRLALGRRTAAIDPAAGTITVEGGEPLAAEAIVLATGSEPARPDIPGLQDPRVLTMRTLADSLALAERTREEARLAVIGTGFIGCEIAGSLAMRGVPVTLIGEERVPQLGRFGEQVGRRIGGWLEALGVQLLAGCGVSAVHDGQVVELEDGRQIRASCVVLGMGASPRGALAEQVGLPMHDGAVAVDQTMCSPASGGALFAVGDVAHAYNVSAGRSLRVEHWGDALGHGEIAGRNLAGERAAWESVPGFWSTIGRQTLKYAAWGDGHDESQLITQPEGGFTAWYMRAGVLVGVLTHDCDEDYERGREMIRAGEPLR